MKARSNRAAEAKIRRIRLMVGHIILTYETGDRNPYAAPKYSRNRPSLRMIGTVTGECVFESRRECQFIFSMREIVAYALDVTRNSRRAQF